MSREKHRTETIWTSTFQDRKGIPAIVSEEHIPAEQMKDILESSLDNERAQPYEAKVDERIFAAIYS